MLPIQLFELASTQARWLSVRQNVVAGNIANANTPQFRAKDVTPFEEVLAAQETRTAGMRATQAGHVSGDPFAAAVRAEENRADVEIMPSGNSVSLAGELMKAGSIKRDMELNVGLVKSFHRMMLMTVRK